MMTAPWMVLLLLLTLHLHHTKYFLVEVDAGDKDSRVSRNSNKALDATPDNATGLTVTFTYVTVTPTTYKSKKTSKY